MSEFELDELEVDTGDYTADELDDLLESGDQEAIEAFLNGDSRAEGESTADAETQEDVEGDSSDAKAEAAEQEAESIDDAQNAETESETDAGDGDEVTTEKVLLSKDGKHQIPYEVLTNTRESLQKSKTQLAEVTSEKEQQAAELEQARKLNDQLRAQLEKNDLKPTDLPENIEINDELLSGLDEYGEIGEVVKALAAQNRALQQQVKTQVVDDTNDNPADAAIARNSDLSDWVKNDADRWEFAVTIDEKLQNDPSFQDKTLDERFAEAVKRTKAAFGDATEQPEPEASKEDVKAKAAEKIAEAKQKQIPQSLTDLGSTPSTEKSLIEQLGEMSEEAMQTKIESMSPDQLEKLYAQL